VNAHSLYADVTFHAKQSLALDWCGWPASFFRLVTALK
jgi:hypothetical protein